MDLRLRNLEQLDARAVPLPHGTEVVTRIDRVVGERRVPQGSVGRVTKVDGEALENAIIVNSAIGGSTNAPIHINAIARHVGVKLDIQDWETVGHHIPDHELPASLGTVKH